MGSNAYSWYLVRHWSLVIARGIAATVACGSAYLVADVVWWLARRSPLACGTGFEVRS